MLKSRTNTTRSPGDEVAEPTEETTPPGRIQELEQAAEQAAERTRSHRATLGRLETEKREKAAILASPESTARRLGSDAADAVLREAKRALPGLADQTHEALQALHEAQRETRETRQALTEARHEREQAAARLKALRETLAAWEPIRPALQAAIEAAGGLVEAARATGYGRIVAEAKAVQQPALDLAERLDKAEASIAEQRALLASF